MTNYRQEEHVIYSYTKICGYFENSESNFSIQMFSDNNHFGPIYFYIIKVSNDGHLDSAGPGIKSLGNYYYYIKSICYLLSLIYGKTFDYLGILKSHDRYNILDFSQKKLKYNYLPWNNQNNRIDIEHELNLVTIGPLVEKLLLKLITSEDFRDFSYITSFYHKGIVNSENDIEISYIDFIRAIEILSQNEENIGDMTDFYEGDLLTIYEKIKGYSKLEKCFNKFHGSTKKFVKIICDNIEIIDLQKTESTNDNFSLKFLCTDVESLRKTLKNAYTIRSGYIHSGKSFGGAILPEKDLLNEIIITGLTANENLKIGKSLTILGLERIIRLTLLKYFNNYMKN